MATFLRWQFLSKICFASFTTRYLLDESNNRRRSQQRRSIIDGSPFKKKKKIYKRDAVSQREKIGRVLLSGSFVSSLLAASPINPFFSHHLHVCRTIIHNIALWCVLVYFYNSYWHKLQTRTVNYFFTFLFPFRFFLFFSPLIDVTRFALAFFSSSFFFFSVKKSFNVVIVVRVYVVIHCRHYDIRENVLLFDGKEKKKSIRSDRIHRAFQTCAHSYVYIYIYIYTYTLQKESYLHATQ